MASKSAKADLGSIPVTAADIEEMRTGPLDPDTVAQDVTDTFQRAMKLCEKLWEVMFNMNDCAERGYELGSVKLLLLAKEGAGPREIEIPVASAPEGSTADLWALVHSLALTQYLATLEVVRDSAAFLVDAAEAEVNEGQEG